MPEGMEGFMVGEKGYELAFEDTFDGDDLDEARWLPYYLPQWSSREASAARYRLGDGFLRLVIEADQPPWCPEFGGETRVSSLQTGVFAGPSAEICICEIFGRNVTAGKVGVGMGLRPFGDPTISDEFSVEAIAIDAREFHLCAAEWTPERVAFFVDHRLVKTVQQSPSYPMQFMLGIYEFPDEGQATKPAHPYPKEFVVDYFRGYRPTSPQPS